MSFQTAISGLSAANKKIDVISHNISNSNTYGFKQSKVEFGDVYANAVYGSGVQAGMGVHTMGVSQQHTQGGIVSTSNPLDLAINGNSFFMLSKQGTNDVYYTRNGQFKLDKNNYIVNANGLNLKGYAINDLGQTVNQLIDLQVDKTTLNPSATTTGNLNFNLNADAPVIATPFNISNSSTWTSSANNVVYDSIGNTHNASYYFTKTGANAWDLNVAIDGTVQSTTALTFDTAGKLATPALGSITVTAPAAGANLLNMTFDLSGTTQFANPFNINNLTQNGYTAGSIVDISITDGVIQGKYSNGQVKNLAQIALANFNNPQGLAAKGDNMYTNTFASGDPMVGDSTMTNFGSITSSALEESNVDMTKELVAMIDAQRMYQANAQTIKTEDQMMQTILSIR